MNSFHTTVYSTGQAVTEPKGEEFVQNFRFCGKGYDTTLKSGMLLTYNVYDSNNKLIRIVDFQL